MKGTLIRLSLALFLITSCGPAPTPEIIVVTATAEPSDEPTETSTVTPTDTPEPTNTPKPTSTKRPTSTPTETVEPRFATQTVMAIQVEATRAYNQNIDDIRKECPPIDWVELSEVEYAKDHEGKCVYIRGTVRDVNFDEQLISVSIGWYSARIAVGISLLNNQNARMTDSMWVNIYGTVETDRWITTNNLSGDSTAIAGIEALLLEGPNGLIWVHE